MDDKKLLVETRGKIAVLTINRERRRNALDDETLHLLRDALVSLKSGDARGIVLGGAGPKAFSAGSDIKELAAQNFDQKIGHTELGQSVADMIEEHPLPVVAAIEGYCLGGGLEMALACDYRVAGKGATLGLPEIKLNALPSWGGTVRLPRVVGIARAREVVMFGRQLGAEEALAWGLVGQVAETGGALAASVALLETIAGSAERRTVTMAKHLLSFGVSAPGRTARQLEYLADMFQLSSPDLEQGVARFLDRKDQ